MTAMEANRPVPTTDPLAAAKDAMRELAEVRQREWPGVRITDVTMVADVPFTPDRHQRVRVHVRLGRLMPADVRVHLTTETHSADTAQDDGWTRRLVASQTYDNGHFVFEGHVPVHVLETMASHLTVVVEALPQTGEMATQLEPVRRRVV